MNKTRYAILALVDDKMQEREDKLKQNIGMLRQFLNERTSDKLLTNEDLEIWLLQK